MISPTRINTGKWCPNQQRACRKDACSIPLPIPVAAGTGKAERRPHHDCAQVRLEPRGAGLSTVDYARTSQWGFRFTNVSV